MAALELDLVPASSPRAGTIWRELEARGRASYFLSWGFLENWIACLPHDALPDVGVITEGGRPIGACLLGSAQVRRHGLIKSRALYLNQSGIPRFDEVTIEHNALVSAPELELGLADFIELIPGDWDELFLSALSSQSFPGRCLAERSPRFIIRIEREAPAPYVDLERVRTVAGDYPALLSANTRAQVRRAERGFGELSVRRPHNELEALRIFDELCHLHQESWRSRDEPGAFADDWFRFFHQRLIRNRFRHGEIQLLRMHAHGKVVGCLYNFVWNGRVLFYQSGFSPTGDARQKPGYACHARAIRLNAAEGRAVYDFLGGSARYKQSLKTDENRLIWATIQRPLARFRAEEELRRWKRALGHGAQSP